MMNRIAIIPARGGSKRIPRKNIRDFFGKPIMAYSIELALESGLFDEVMVSTEDAEIAEIARKYGATIPFIRSEENANDFAGTMEVIHEVLMEYKTQLQKTFDYGCCIYPTAPLVDSKNIREGLEKLVKENLDTVFPVVAYTYPIWRGLEISENNKVQMLWPENKNKRSQDLKPVYHDAGQWYWFKISKMGDSLFTENTGAIVLPEEQVQDIDNLSDWKIAEMKYEYLQSIK